MSPGPRRATSPPRTLRRLLAWALPRGPVRDGLLGDLEELYGERVRRSRVAADLWYAGQLASALVHYLPRRLLAQGGGGGMGMMHGIARDVAFAVRTLARRPGFTAVIVLTLALGIGANTAVFSVVRSVLLRPLPFPEDERLAVVEMRTPGLDISPSPPEYVAYRDHARSWEELAAYQVGAATITEDGGEPERIDVALATWDLFTALGIDPLLGRRFTPADGQEGADEVAMLSHAFWTSRYGGDPQVIGRTVQLSGIPYTVVGVMPARFRFPTPEVRLWLPIAFAERDLQSRGNHTYSVIGRLRPEVTLGSAEHELETLVERFVADPSMSFHPWHPVYLRPLRSELVGDVRHTLWVMLGAAALVLLIACANVANMLLVRAEERARELSVRTALGAGRRRLVGQFLTESLVTAGAGGLVGVAVAYMGVDALRLVAPADLPRLDEIGVDAGVLWFTALVTIGAGVLFGLIPALHWGRSDLSTALRSAGRAGTAGRHRMRLRQLLVVSQTAFAVVLLVAAGLLLQSFRGLMAVDPGFSADSVLTARVTVPAQKYAEGRDLVAFYESLLPRVASLPGVGAAGAVLRAPLGGGLTATDVEVEGWVDRGDAPPLVDVQAVTPGYFEAMGIAVPDGRPFDERDGMDAPLVAMVSEGLAREYWPGRSALGGRIRLAWDSLPFMQVVGVVPEVRHVGLDRPPARGTLYLAFAQTPSTWGRLRAMTLAVRSSVEPMSLVSAIRSEVRALDPGVPVYQVRTMEQAVADTTATRRFSMLLQLLFALVALSLAAVGLYGVLAFTVARRTAEIGIRMALGARRPDVQRMVVGQGMGIVAFALVLGLCGAFAAGRLMESLLFGVSARDPATYGAAVAVLSIVALLACWIPSRRASGVDPAVALRSE